MASRTAMVETHRRAPAPEEMLPLKEGTAEMMTVVRLVAKEVMHQPVADASNGKFRVLEERGNSDLEKAATLELNENS